jgi:kynureninase
VADGPFQPGREFADALDRQDPLRRFRHEFHVPERLPPSPQPSPPQLPQIPSPPRGGRGQGRGGDDPDEEIYFAGNSLGLLPKRTRRYVDDELEKWARLAVKAHFSGDHPWMPYHELLAEPMARLVGASPTEVVTMNSLTANLHLMMASFYRPTPERHRILLEERAFPSDDYALESQARFHGFDPAEALVRVRSDEIARFLERAGDSIALVLLPGVQYYTGEAFDIAAITRLAHAQGCVAGFDLAHAAGNLVLRLHDWGVDFAVWCTYKYLNSGPGSVGGCFVHERHGRRTDLPRLAGWWGHDKALRFRMESGFRPIPGAEGWQLSNPPILSLAAIRASLDVFVEAGGMEPLRAKSLRLTGYLEWLLQREIGEAVEVITPADPNRRGCQLSLRVKSKTPGRTVFERLEAAGVTGDWREPDVIRVAPVPLYNRYEEVWRFVEILRGAL